MGVRYCAAAVAAAVPVLPEPVRLLAQQLGAYRTMEMGIPSIHRRSAHHCIKSSKEKPPVEFELLELAVVGL